MSSIVRIHQIVKKACDARTTGFQLDLNDIEIETSCAQVPIGFVRAASAVLLPDESPDSFWSQCLASDSYVDICSCAVEVEENPKLDEVLRGMYEDLARVNAYDTIEIPVLIHECFALHECCESCCGSMLLIRTDSKAYYVHWHRES